MRTQFEVNAEPRSDQGKGASRRLRHAGKVPAIIYGGKGEPTSLSLNHQKMLLLVDNEKFYSSIITLNVDGKPQPAIVKDVQMHPARNAIVHVDLQRVLEDQPIRIHLPIHFLNEASSPGVKVQGGVVSHMRSDIEILCLPKDLPEALEVDMAAMNLNDTVYLADLKLPPGVTVPELTHGHNAPVVSIHSPRVEEPEPVVETVAAAATTTPAAGATPAADGKDAKKDAAAPAKKEGGKK
jgi:large subunit ribosomal protein L25